MKRRLRILRALSRKPEPSSPRTAQLDADLAEIIHLADRDLRHFAGARIFITGGTGFVGTWLLWSIVEANRRLGIDIRADVLSRNPETFAAREGEIAAASGIRFLRGDIVDPVPSTERYDAIIHAATPASAKLLRDSPQTMLDIILRGSRHIADFAERCGAVPVLFTSSGAIYGRLPASLETVDESYGGAPDSTEPRAAYQEGKRCGELMCTIAAERSRGRALIARLFAFVGPYLPLDQHFAIGNFLHDRLAGRPIQVAGDGTAIRSYLYAVDLTVWLWAIMARGQSRRPYNVGSSEAISIAELSRQIAGIESPQLDVIFARPITPGGPPDRYVPANDRIRGELGVSATVALGEACRRTLRHVRGT